MEGFAFPKKKRVEDPELLELVRTFPCLACGSRPSDAHHVTSRGAGGNDVAENLMPLCREHHAIWHQLGGLWMARQYPAVRNWLEGAERWDILKEREPCPNSEPDPL